MLRTLILAVGLMAALVLQPLVNESASRTGFAVSLPVLIGILALFLKPASESLIWAAMAGLVGDTFHTAPFGFDMLWLVLMVFAVRQIVGGSQRIPATLTSVAVTTAVITFCVTLASAASRALWAHIPVVPMTLLSLSLGHTLGNLAAALMAVVGWRCLEVVRSTRRSGWRVPV